MNKIIKKKKQRSKIIMLVLNYIKENRRYYLIAFGFFFIGFIISLLFINNLGQEQLNEISEHIKELSNNFINSEKIDYIKLLKQSIFSNVIIIFVIWLASSTIIGIPIVYAEVTYRGFILGYTIGCVLITLGIKDGTFFNISALLLHNIIFIPVLLATAVSGMKTYKSIIENREKENIKIKFLRHTIFSIIMLILLIISSVVEVYFSTNLTKLILEFIKI